MRFGVDFDQILSGEILKNMSQLTRFSVYLEEILKKK